MRVLGIVCGSDGCDWALVSEESLGVVELLTQEKIVLPPDRWYRQLSWMRKEFSALLARVSPDVVALRAAQGGPNSRPSTERLQIEAAVYTAIADADLDLVTFHSATVSKATKLQGGEAVFAESTPHIRGVAKSRRGPVLVATYALAGHGMRK